MRVGFTLGWIATPLPDATRLEVSGAPLLVFDSMIEPSSCPVARRKASSTSGTLGARSRE
jgi:hypothetical protein